MRQLTPEEAFACDPGTGFLHWEPRPEDTFATPRAARIWNTRFAGKRAGTVDRNGHRQVKWNGGTHREHRIIWRLVTGEWPKDEIDHINGVYGDNRWENLREASRVENARNQKQRTDNTSGRVGVCFDRERRRWVAWVGLRGRTKFLGRFATKEEAVAARTAAEIKYGFHPNHGRLG